MPRNNRPPRRQGVVYGPTAADDRGSDAGSLVGRIVGMLVVAGAVGVLIVGALAFMRGGGAVPGATSTATLAARVSPPPTAIATRAPFASPTVGATPSPAPTVVLTPPVTPGVSPVATPFELAVREGPGYVTFGTEEGARLRIVDPRTSFDAEETVIFSAHLTEPASSDELRLIVFRVDMATGSEQQVREYEIRPRVPSAQIFLRRLRPAEALPGPGVYAVRYLRGTEVMAEGYFQVRD